MVRKLAKGKSVFVTLALLMVPVFALSAAGSKQDTGDQSKGIITLSTVRTMNSTILFDQNDPEKRSFDENRWNKAYFEELGVRLEHKWIASDSASDTIRWNTAMASGDVPDFAIVNNSIYKLLYDADLIADMGDVFKKNISPELSSIIPDSYLQQMTFNGKMYGFPLPSKAFNGSDILFVRKDWLDKLRLPVPQSVEDVLSVALAFKEAKFGGSDTIGILFGNGTGNDGKWSGLMNGYGAYRDYWLEKNGQLVFSNIQDEMKGALLAMQALYLDGIMNKDFAVTNSALAQEYVAGGKVGIFYGTSYITTTSLLTLHNTDPKAEVINIFPPSLKGKNYPIQTSTPQARRVFVSKKCANPEAVIKMANLTLKLQNEKDTEYWTGPDGFIWYKYIPLGGDVFVESTYDLDQGNLIRQAENTGSLGTNNLTVITRYENYKKSKTGDAPYWYTTTFGPDATYTILYDAYHSNKLLTDAFLGLPTDTMALKQTIINDELTTAMVEVIMGANIRTFEQAVEKWKASGGQQITDEVNAWYRSK
jgi:putative aldouronate transport system substrate-binding protein